MNLSGHDWDIYSYWSDFEDVEQMTASGYLATNWSKVGARPRGRL